MPNPISSAARTELRKPAPRIRKTLDVVFELYNADLRSYTDLTQHVYRWGTQSGASTIKSNNWQIPSQDLALVNLNNYLSPGLAGSLWVALGVAPDECWVRVRILADLPDGTSETVHLYYGKIIECIPRADSSLMLVDLKTRHAADEALSAGIAKQSGDELVMLGSGW